MDWIRGRIRTWSWLVDRGVWARSVSMFDCETDDSVRSQRSAVLTESRRKRDKIMNSQDSVIRCKNSFCFLWASCCFHLIAILFIDPIIDSRVERSRASQTVTEDRCWEFFWFGSQRLGLREGKLCEEQTCCR